MSRLHVVSALPCRKGTWTEGRRRHGLLWWLWLSTSREAVRILQQCLVFVASTGQYLSMGPGCSITPRLGALSAWVALLGNHGRRLGDI